MNKRLSLKIKPLVRLFFPLLIAAVFFSCQKELSSEGFIPTAELPDLSSRIPSSISGFVTDENNMPVKDADVKFGSSTTTTDKFGFFEIKNVSVVKNAAVVKVKKPGYFNAIKTYSAIEGKANFCRIKLLPKTIAGTVDAATGGTVSLATGMKVSLPADAVMTASGGAAYSGPVNIALQWLNPVAEDLYQTMPGDLRGLNTDGALKLLETYGMAAVELIGNGGQPLQVAPGKKALLEFPLPTALLGKAPATIPLWYFDEALGLWKEEGSAVKNGNTYKGDVSHFSYWNCDIPLQASVKFDVTIQDANGQPIPNAHIVVKYDTGSYTGAHGFTDNNGFVSGRVPANTNLTFEVFTSKNCLGGPAYRLTVSTTTADFSLGIITISDNFSAVVTGTVMNCNNTPVTDGYVVALIGYNYYKTEVKTDGSFSLKILVCDGGGVPVNLLAVDNAAQVQSNVMNIMVNNGNNPVGTIAACGITIEEYINFTINGNAYALTPPTIILRHEGTATMQYISAYGSTNQNNNGATIIFSGSGIGVGVLQNLVRFNTSEIRDSTSILTPIDVHITEFGAVSEYIAGNFSGTLTGAPPANTPYVVACSFRVKRR
ncbi:MAG TPA: Ig-like domain-containing protein [Ferruginibacter sp.]|nr:Ig-like domain-containing protein [Ferruginibacter sp.]HMP20760.1 Ig-like domain-containing protein [Ferruginibacter sp.]